MAKKARQHVALEQDHATRTPQIWVGIMQLGLLKYGWISKQIVDMEQVQAIKYQDPSLETPFLQQGSTFWRFYNLPKQCHQLGTKYVNTWACGPHFTLKPTSVLAFCAAWSEHDKSPWKWNWLRRKCSCVFTSGWGQRWASNHFFLFPNNWLKRRHFLCWRD